MYLDSLPFSSSSGFCLKSVSTRGRNSIYPRLIALIIFISAINGCKNHRVEKPFPYPENQKFEVIGSQAIDSVVNGQAPAVFVSERPSHNPQSSNKVSDFLIFFKDGRCASGRAFEASKVLAKRLQDPRTWWAGFYQIKNDSLEVELYVIGPHNPYRKELYRVIRDKANRIRSIKSLGWKYQSHSSFIKTTGSVFSPAPSMSKYVDIKASWN